MKKYSWFDPSTFHPARGEKGYTLLLLSHIPYIVPLALALSRGLMVLVSVFALQVACSVLYHASSRTTVLRVMDYVSAIILAMVALMHIYAGRGAPDFAIKMVALGALGICTLRFFFWQKSYAYEHSLWHVCIAFMMSVVII